MSNNFEITVLKKLDNMDNKFTNMILENRTILNEHTKTLAKHGKILDEHTKTLAKHGKILDEHTKTLAKHGKILDEHTKMISENRKMIELNGKKISENREMIELNGKKISENREMIELNGKKISENKDMILANKNVILNLVKKVDENTKAIEDLSTVAYSAYKGYENNIGKMRKENKRLTDISEENQQEHQFFKKDLRSLHSKILNHNTRISLLEKIKKQKEEIKI